MFKSLSSNDNIYVALENDIWKGYWDLGIKKKLLMFIGIELCPGSAKLESFVVFLNKNGGIIVSLLSL